MTGQGSNSMQNASARVASNYQRGCYHEGIVIVKINW